MENVLVFLRAAAPWISLGLLLAFFCVRPSVKKRKTESDEGDYAVDGMCIGMCVGMTVGSLIGDGNGGLGTSLGMMIGLAIGLSIPRKSEKGQQQKKGQK